MDSPTGRSFLVVNGSSLSCSLNHVKLMDDMLMKLNFMNWLISWFKSTDETSSTPTQLLSPTAQELTKTWPRFGNMVSQLGDLSLPCWCYCGPEEHDW